VLLLLALAGPRRASPPRLAVAVAACALLALLTRGEEVRFEAPRVRRDSTATVIATGSGPRQGLLVNGVGMTYLTPITKFMAHLPLAFVDHAPRRGLVICFGMGTSFRSMHSWGIETTAVELVPSVPPLFPEFHPDAAGLLRSPRARIVIDDGRRFLDRTADRFDAIIVDPPPPVEAAGSSLLYSREFYAAMRPRLAPGGIVQAWVPGAEPAVGAAFALALREVFPHVRVYRSVEGWGAHFLASETPIPDRTPEELAARMPPEAAADLVAWGPHRTAAEQLRAVLTQQLPVDWPYLERQAPPLTDDRPLNEYFLLRRLRAGRVLG
jgi:hypothetical protein